jgi:tetratricopeptide (TPR) repeat protein
VDSGNAAFKAKDYQRALGHYREATRLDDDAAAPWFGIYMVQRALGNLAAADSALKRAQKVAPGASLIHPKPNARDTQTP